MKKLEGRTRTSLLTFVMYPRSQSLSWKVGARKPMMGTGKQQGASSAVSRNCTLLKDLESSGESTVLRVALVVAEGAGFPDLCASQSQEGMDSLPVFWKGQLQRINSPFSAWCGCLGLRKNIWRKHWHHEDTAVMGNVDWIGGPRGLPKNTPSLSCKATWEDLSPA